MADKKELVIVRQERFDTIFETTINDMKMLGTYKAEFSPIIVRYAEMRLQLEVLMDRWYRGGCKITE